MNKAVVRLLSNLKDITPVKMAERLSSVRQQIGQDDWNGLLYGIEELAKEGRTALAEAFMDVCLSVAEANEDGWASRAVTYFWGDLYYLQGKVELAIEAYQKVFVSGLAADEDGRIQASIAISSVARVQMAQGHVAEAILTIQQAIALGEQLGREADAVGDQLTLAGLYLIQEDFAQSEALLQATLAQAKQLGRAELTALALMRLASLQEDLNQPAAAIPYYEAALAELDAEEETEDDELFFMAYRETLVGLGMAYDALGQPQVAITHYAEASRLAHWLGEARQQAVVLTWLGTAQLGAGQANLAVRSFRAAERLAQQSGHTWWLGKNSFFWASAWQALGEWEAAETAVQQARAYHAAVSAEHSADEIGCLVKLGEIAVGRGLLETAVDYYQQALVLLERVEIGQMHRLIYLRLGEAFWYQGEFVAAYEKLRDALNVYESKRQNVSELWRRVDYAPARDLVYEYLVRTCLALGRVEEALTAVEEGRMRVFREQLEAQFITEESVDALDWVDVKLLLFESSASRK